MGDIFKSHTPERLNNSKPETTTIKCGIFYADQDIDIAKRIRDAVQHGGCTTSLFNFLQAGEQKLQQIEKFICENKIVLWIATSSSLQDTTILNAACHIANYASIARPEIGVKYITVKPREYLSLKLPLVLDSYTCLIENDDFETSIDVTLKAIKGKGAKTQASAQSTATTNAISDDANNFLRQVAPRADVGEVRTPSHVTIVNIHHAVDRLQIADTIVNQEENGKENESDCKPTETSKPKCFKNDDDDEIFYPAEG